MFRLPLFWYNVDMRQMSYKKIIFHMDVNSAYLSWEAAYRIHEKGESIDLREIPSAVGGDVEKRHGIILAKSIPAKKFGVQTGEPVMAALKKCPELTLVRPNFSLYCRSSDAAMALLHEYTDKVEQYSIDEAFMDMTGCTKDPVATADEIRRRMREELGFTVNVGVAENKLLAKMASDFQKPDKTHTLWREEIPAKMWVLPVEDLFFIGRSTAPKLAAMGIKTIGQLAATDREVLYSHFKKHGYVIHDFANGIDNSALDLDTEGPNKGYGNSLTTPVDITEIEDAKPYLLQLAETVSARLREDHVKISVVAVSIRDCDLVFYNHQMKLRNATDLTAEIYEAACQCLAEMWSGYPLRHFGIHTSKVELDSTRQISMFDTHDYAKQKKAEDAVDELRERFGKDIVKRASLM